MAQADRILGIDTSLRSTGWGVIESAGSRVKALAFGRIRNPASRPHSACLVELARAVREAIAAWQPVEVAMEGVFFAKNLHTTLILGQARGAVITVCGEAGLPVYEYAPRRVKQAVVGVGGAQKQQVVAMVRARLGLEADPMEDEADALAIALCHAQNRTSVEALRAKTI